MTMNGHCASKSGPNSASSGLTFWLSGKTVRKFAELHIDCQRPKNVAQLVLYVHVKCSPACTGDIRAMELFTGRTEQEESNQ